jgi:hypothetical protein
MDSSDQIIAMIVATSFAAGLNIYATVGTLGLLDRFDVIALPAALDPIASWWIIGACGVLFSIEFIADKIPGVDLVWQALHTFIRVPAAGVLAWSAAAPLSPRDQLLAAGLGAVLALAAHAGKMAMRAAVTPSPEPLSNTGLSLVEDAGAIGLTWFATSHPFIAAGIVLGLLVLMILVVRLLWRAMRALFSGAGRKLGVEREGPA